MGGDDSNFMRKSFDSKDLVMIDYGMAKQILMSNGKVSKSFFVNVCWLKTLTLCHASSTSLMHNMSVAAHGWQSGIQGNYGLRLFQCS